MKRKIMAVILTAAMALSLVACGSGSAAAPAADAAPAEDAAPAADAAPAEDAAPAADAAAPAADAAGGTPTIAFVPKVEGQAWWDYVHSGVDQWAADNGIEVIYKGPTEIDAAAQVQIMTDLVNQGVDILCFSPNDPDACEAICKQAMDKGIIVIATEASGMKNVNYDIEAFDEAGMGGFLMDQLAAQMGEEGKYITMVGSMTMESQNNWADAAVARQE
ncbi:MAG: substrate-binding domain-containing protein, partial [Lachnospiraceae bacterium]|nr:substrate-binding domain-containing protein [Lachnospiraceae bacterium]